MSAPTQVATWNHVSASGKFAAGSTAVLFLPRSTSLARAPVASGRARKVAAANRQPRKTRVAQTPNARSGTHVAVSKAAPRKGKTVVAHKAGGRPQAGRQDPRRAALTATDRAMTHPIALETWHRLVRTNDASGLRDLVAEDAVFHSPVVHAAQQGRKRR